MPSNPSMTRNDFTRPWQKDTISEKNSDKKLRKRYAAIQA